jgi:hypothetical protein
MELNLNEVATPSPYEENEENPVCFLHMATGIFHPKTGFSPKKKSSIDDHPK